MQHVCQACRSSLTCWACWGADPELPHRPRHVCTAQTMAQDAFSLRVERGKGSEANTVSLDIAVRTVIWTEWNSGEAAWAGHGGGKSSRRWSRRPAPTTQIGLTSPWRSRLLTHDFHLLAPEWPRFIRHRRDQGNGDGEVAGLPAIESRSERMPPSSGSAKADQMAVID